MQKSEDLKVKIYSVKALRAIPKFPYAVFKVRETTGNKFSHPSQHEHITVITMTSYHIIIYEF